MLKITNTKVERDEDEGMTYTSYDVEGTAGKRDVHIL